MNLNPDIVLMILMGVAVNAVAALLLFGLSYFGSALALEGLAFLDKWLSPSSSVQPERPFNRLRP
jgi:hypothetical protein